jgi:hypothetical protein
VSIHWAFGALHTTFDVIGTKLEVRDNFLIATILQSPTTVCWRRTAFGALGNPSNVPDIGGCLLGMAFTIGFVQDPSNVSL